MPERLSKPFVVHSRFEPAGDQPQAIEELSAAVSNGERFVTLRGITGSGKSATMAWTIERLGRPALVIAPNKSLAAQLAAELGELLPENKVCFFVSYYDSYTPESYVPAADMYIEKQASVNAEIDRLRHEATAAALFRRDVVVVASVSCIYGLGAPDAYAKSVRVVRRGQEIDVFGLARELVAVGYDRNDVDVARGCFAVRGDTLEVHLPGEEHTWRIEVFGDEVERIRSWNPLEGTYGDEVDEVYVWPATHYTADTATLERACDGIEGELEARLAELRDAGKLLEAQRLEQRTRSDLERLREMGSVAGVENYSRWLDGRDAGEPPHTLVEYLDQDMVVFIDESHVAVPQLQGAWAGDASRKGTLIEHGFRLPSAADNRPLRWEEFLDAVGQVVFVSATPGPLEREVSATSVELVVRPTGLVDPDVSVRSQVGQLEDLLGEIRENQQRDERTLVTCVTKKQAEDLADWLLGRNVKARYLHSDIDTIERIALVRDLRLGAYDVLVGVNLLREGLDLPEVSLVAILDADKEGFLRSETALVQTIGRAARNVRGRVVLYAERVTPAMQAAIDETARRRERQLAWNAERGIEPKTVPTPVRDLLIQARSAEKPGRTKRRQAAGRDVTLRERLMGLSVEELTQRAEELEAAMTAAAEQLAFERAAELRDELEVVLELAMNQPS